MRPTAIFLASLFILHLAQIYRLPASLDHTALAEHSESESYSVTQVEEINKVLAVLQDRCHLRYVMVTEHAGSTFDEATGRPLPALLANKKLQKKLVDCCGDVFSRKGPVVLSSSVMLAAGCIGAEDTHLLQDVFSICLSWQQHEVARTSLPPLLL